MKIGKYKDTILTHDTIRLSEKVLQISDVFECKEGKQDIIRTIEQWSSLIHISFYLDHIRRLELGQHCWREIEGSIALAWTMFEIFVCPTIPCSDIEDITISHISRKQSSENIVIKTIEMFSILTIGRCSLLISFEWINDRDSMFTIGQRMNIEDVKLLYYLIDDVLVK